MEIKYIIIPLIGAFIGWLTNYIAIKLLFRPHLPVNVMGFNIQGVIPKRRKDIARGIAHTIEEELFSSRDIATVLSGIDWKAEVEKTVEDAVEHRFGGGRFTGIPVIGIVSENIKYHIKYLITREALKQIDKKKDVFKERFRESVDIKELVLSRIDALDLARFEGLLTRFIARELRHLEWLGALMGFIIGIFQAVAMYYIAL
ncbi:MAG: DUF445 family protein [Deltaproteobacteria bacterium]|nr:DUF445 family protein [Deltaproteobacteria bacterium]